MITFFLCYFESTILHDEVNNWSFNLRVSLNNFRKNFALLIGELHVLAIFDNFEEQNVNNQGILLDPLQIHRVKSQIE